ncbi:MAG: CoA:oxalate CoA-transferase, partial [Frankiaceae bacterium]|nr:CoA:oxalate CoA-transferase [Frankiaceae bacterium]
SDDQYRAGMHAAGPLPGPLEGLLVVDLSRVLAGPFATMLLADLGARVVKVEKPGTGDDSRSYGPFVGDRSLYFARVNRGKQSISLDLTSPGDRTVLFGLVDRADVLVENFRPDVMDRLDLGYDALAERNPRLVYASISGFGQTGPWRLRPAYDTVVQGSSGLMSVTGAVEDGPVKPGLPVADLSAGLYTFGAILAAVRGRELTGRGTHVDVAMHDSLVSMLEGAAQSFLATGAPPPRIGNAHYSIAPFDTYNCADRPVIICAANDTLFAGLCGALGRHDLVVDPRFRSNADRHDHRAALKAEIEAVLVADTGEHWLERFAAVGVPSGPVSDIAEALTSEQIAARRMVVSAGGLPMPGTPVKLRDFPDPMERPAAPELDEHGPALRAEFGPA